MVIYVVGWWTYRFFAFNWCFGDMHDGCLKGKWVSVVFDRSKRGSRTGNCDLFCSVMVSGIKNMVTRVRNAEVCTLPLSKVLTLPHGAVFLTWKSVKFFI